MWLILLAAFLMGLAGPVSAGKLHPSKAIYLACNDKRGEVYCLAYIRGVVEALSVATKLARLKGEEPNYALCNNVRNEDWPLITSIVKSRLKDDIENLAVLEILKALNGVLCK
jgi:hypothetical protein